MVALLGLAIFIQFVALESIILPRSPAGPWAVKLANPVALPTFPLLFSRRGQLFPEHRKSKAVPKVLMPCTLASALSRVTMTHAKRRRYCHFK